MIRFTWIKKIDRNFDKDDWVEKQIEFRFSGISKKRTPLLSTHQDFECKVKKLGLFLPSEHRFANLNGLNSVLKFNPTQNEYIVDNSIDRMTLARGFHNEHGIVNRTREFANLVHSWGFSSPYFCNWGDAQGWNYDIAAPELTHLPIIQYARRQSQRNQIVLFPLNFNYMGINGPNLPVDFDNIEFKSKKNALVWRGRYSGTFSHDWNNRIHWAMELVKNDKETSINEQKIGFYKNKYPRYQVVKMMSSVEWADIAFILTEDEHKIVHNNQWKTNFLMPYVKQPLSIEEQINNKFILALPGNDCPSNIYWALLSNSVTFVLDSEWETALYCGLKPWEHYVPVKLSKDDFSEKFEKMVSNPKLCLEIIENAHQFMQPFLDHDLRDAADYETLRYYQDLIIPVLTLDKKWSYSRKKD